MDRNFGARGGITSPRVTFFQALYQQLGQPSGRCLSCSLMRNSIFGGKPWKKNVLNTKGDTLSQTPLDFSVNLSDPRNFQREYDVYENGPILAKKKDGTSLSLFPGA